MWEVHLVLESDVKGVPTAYDLVPAGAKEYEPVYGLAVPGSLLFCDKSVVVSVQTSAPGSSRMCLTPASVSLRPTESRKNSR